MSTIQGAPRPQIQELPVNHKRNKSASILKSMGLPQKHKRNNSEDVRPSPRPLKENTLPIDTSTTATSIPLLPADHPHSGMIMLRERKHLNEQSPSKKKAADGGDKRPKGLHKKTLSTVSLRELAKINRSKDSLTSPKKPSEQGDNERKLKHKKSKSSNNLAAVFARAKGGRVQDKPETPLKDQENTTPPDTRDAPTAQTPIWEQFNSQSLFEQTSITKVPLNDRRSVEHELSLYEPIDYSPSKQRNFHGYAQPTLSKPRPKSECLPSSQSSSSFMDTLSRKISNEIGRKPSLRKHIRAGSSHSQGSNNNVVLKPSKSAPVSSKNGAAATRKGSRVMAAVSMFNSKAKEALPEPPLDAKQIEAEFEALLESRNIPENMREKMRSLQTRVKADFIRSHKVEQDVKGSSEAKAGFKLWSEPQTPVSATVAPNDIDVDDKEELTQNVLAESAKLATNTKRSRPRSKTFTFSKGETSPAKKHKGNSNMEEEGNTKSDLIKSASSLSFGGLAGSKALKAAAPEEYVSYLRRVTQPEVVETAKMHKLRLLLRNETVAWVDTFIRLGGMTEVVGLLHKIMKVEWR